MLILPERGAPRGKLLMPMRPAEWRQPSQRRQLHGRDDQTFFRLRALLPDGRPIWAGWFEDREDADAFLLAMVTDRLRLEPALWRLPRPAWNPDLGDFGLTYDFASVTFLTTVGVGSYPVPADYAPSGGLVECIAGGGGGGGGANGAGGGGGGGGGGYSNQSAVTLTVGGTATYTVGGAGTGGSGTGVAGGAGGDTWFNGATLAVSSVGARAGGGGLAGGVGGQGGPAGTAIGAIRNTGGAGANNVPGEGAGNGGGGAAGANGAGFIGGNGNNGGGGGGGANGSAAGSNGAAGTNAAGGSGGGPNGGGGGNTLGSNGASGTTGTPGGGGGGGGANGTGGVAGFGGTGGVGTDYARTPIPFGAGGGAGAPASAGGGHNTNSGSTGGLYGGGGSGGATLGGGGNGSQALIVVTYTAFSFIGGYEPQRPGDITPPSRRFVRGAAFAQNPIGELENIVNFNAVGFQPEVPQPPSRISVARWAALAPREDGIEHPFTFVQQTPFAEGWQVQHVQPPNPNTGNLANQNTKAGSIMRVDDGSYALKTNFFGLGFPIQPPQPPHPVPERRAASVMRGDDGNYARLIIPFREGWAIQPPQPPHPWPERRAGATMRGDDGVEGLFIHAPFSVGWEQVPSPLPPQRWPRPQIAAGFMAGDDGTYVPIFYPFMRFEPDLPVVRRWPLANRSPEVGDTGIEAPRPRAVWGWDPALHQPRKIFREIFQATTLVERPPPFAVPGAWLIDEAQLVRPRRRVSAVEIEPALVPLPRYIPWGEDHPEVMALRKRRLQALDAVPTIIVPPRAIWGWSPVLLDPRRPQRRLLVDRDGDLPEPHFVTRFDAGFMIQPWQPPRFLRSTAASMMRGDDGTQGLVIIPFAEGWQPTLFWPPHPRPERAGAIMASDASSAVWPFLYLVPSGAIAWDYAVWVAAAYDIGMPP